MSRAQNKERSWGISRTALLAAVVTFLVLGSSGIAYAYWSANATLNSTARSGSIAVSLANVDSIKNTFVNDTRLRTGSITVTNTSASPSTTPLPVTINLGIVAGGSTVLASNLNVTLWGPMTAASCTDTATPSGTVKTGTWSSFPALSSTLTAGQATTWCLRTSNTERSGIASTTGSLSIQPAVTVNLAAGTWTATASANTTQNTQYIFPAAVPDASSWFSIKTSAGTCLEVSGSGGAGASLIPMTCSVVPAQAFGPAGADANGYLAVTPKGAPSLRLDNTGSVASGSPATLQSTTGAGSQAWQLQQAASGVYQIVNKVSGLCLVPSAVAPYSSVQVLCDGSAGQRFTLAPLTFTFGLGCTNDGNLGSKGRVTFSWSAGAAGSYTVKADKDSSAGFDWQTIGTSTTNSTSIAIDGTLPVVGPITSWPTGSYDVRVVDTAGGVAAVSKITVRPSGGLECG